MTPERWKKIEDIFQDAVDCEPAERERFIREQCAGDEELRLEVEKLVARSETGENFLESPVWTDSAILQSSIKRQIVSALEEVATPDEKPETFIGQQIGVYRLVSELGRGGMGIVFLAERADGEFQQKVAIKLIKRGMDTDFIVRRFRHERQILASLNHPNIARLLDGGTTKDDLPYFVMEFIEGQPLFKYCQENRLNLRQKLELFLSVCAAIEHAHKRRIIHRDIKPGNILITEEGAPKLLDFGIAKILDPDLIHESVAPTATQMRLMTPEYASPEQVRGEEITPASDQYSLGVLLYELVTGARPYKFPNRAAHEIARIICEEEPSEPSSGEFGKQITEDKSLPYIKEISHRLDRVVLKSLRKHPKERYASVKELSADIERFLNNEPVMAESFTGDFGEAEPVIESQKSIAVLPFKLLSAIVDEQTGGDEFLGIGLADALITRLSNIHQLFVRPTNSVLRYGGNEPDAFTAGGELNVDYVLDGTAIRIDKRIRISVQLLDIEKQSTVWAERYDENFTDVLQLEDTISAKVAESLISKLTVVERQNLARHGTDNPAAYEAYLRGRYYWNTFSDEGFRRAISFYREAITLDPNYALAHAGIADYYIWLGVYGVLAPKDCYPAAKEAARRAIEIDDKLAEAYAALGFAELCGDYDWTASEKNARRALELNPNYPVGHLWYAFLLLSIGRFDEGIDEARRAVELDPLTYTNFHTVAWGYYFARRYGEALNQSVENIKKFPDFSLAHFTRSWILRRTGKTAEAVKASEKALELSGDSLFIRLGHAQALAADGRDEEVEELLREIETEAEKHYVSYYQAAIAYCYLNDKEQAFAALERALAEKEGWLIWLAVEPALEILRDDPRYKELLERINHPLAPSKASGSNKAAFSEAETAHFPPRSAAQGALKIFKYAAAVLVLLGISYGLYRVVNNSGTSSPRPPSAPSAPAIDSWQNTFTSTMSIKRLTSTGKEVLAAISPDGDQIAFVSVANNQQTLRLRPTEGGNEARQLVAAAPVIYLGITFSPDGKTVYYTVLDASYTYRALYRLSLTADEKPQKLVETNIVSAASLTADGKTLAYFGMNMEKQSAMSLYLCEIDAGGNLSPPVEAVTLLHPEHFVGNPALAPDGTKIVYAANVFINEQHTTKFFVYDTRSKSTEKLETPEFFDVFDVVWRNSGQELVISASENNGAPHQLWVIDFPSGAATRLTNDLTDYSSVSIDKDSTALVTARSETHSDIWRSNLGTTNDPVAAIQLTEGVNRQDGIEGLQWTRDNKIVYVAEAESERLVKMINPDGSDGRTIGPGDALPSYPLISADNRFLFYIDNRKLDVSIWRYDLTDGKLVHLTNVTSFTPTLTPDNRFIIYAAENDHHQLLLHRISTDGGEPVKLTAPLSLAPAVSPDNRHLAYLLRNKETGGKWEIGVSEIGHEDKPRLIKIPGEVTFWLGPLQEPLSWSPDSRFIFYMNDKDGVSNVYRVSIDGKQPPEQMTHFTSGKFFNFAVSPDGKQAALSRGSTLSDIVIFKRSK